MEDIRGLKDIIKKGDFMAKLDLMDAYFSVPINPANRKFLQFRWRNKTSAVYCLPFGLSITPFVFTKVCHPVLSTLRKQGILHCLMYLYDLLVMAKTKEVLKENYRKCSSLLISLGFMIMQ